MASNSPVWARSVLEILLALDIVQVRVRLPNGKFAAKAVLLPTHPLHLWRNERLSTLLRGLNQSTSLDESDRALLRKELERPEQFLSVVRLGSIPAGRGLNQLLPLTSSNELPGMPVFENLINACSGSDGAADLRKALDQYVILHPNHPYPLRLALVNPPREMMLTELVGLLNDPRYRGGQKMSAVDVAIYATGLHSNRLRAALSFSDPRKEDDVQEKVASERLRLHIDKSCLESEPELHDIVGRIRAHPCHLTAIFDESTIRLRQRGAKKSLPMSPFCIRYEIQVDQRTGTIELRPEPGESPFSEFLLLMNELEGNQRDATPHAYADAEALAGTPALATTRPPFVDADSRASFVSRIPTLPEVEDRSTQPWLSLRPSVVAPGSTSDDENIVTTARATEPTIGEEWPPAVNKLGMIGQYQEVELLVKQALFSKTMKVRFSDKLLVGPAGVGKSTLARKIGELLLNREPLFFNGSDLRKPMDLLDRLRQEGLLPDDKHIGTLQVLPCLIFIDEVHGIANSVATTLLSAMDDRRITSIDGQLYDFNGVIFLLATTDQGKLSEAFQSRPNKTWLRPYNLHELAGIVWLHGKDCLDGTELPRDACYEIAARMCCNPRRAVRELGEILRPHFFHQAMEGQSGNPPSLRQLAGLITRENVAAFYEAQGIDFNGLDNAALRFLRYLKQHGAASEATLSQALGLPNKRDFVEVSEYLMRLGLIETFPGGRRLTRDGTKYLNSTPPPDLRNLISRAI